MKDDVIKKVALDIGNNGIKLLVGEMSSDFQRISVTNYVKTKSKGISKSLIENPEALAETLREAIGKAESIESPITKLSLALGGPGILSATVNVKSSFPEKEIEKLIWIICYGKLKGKFLKEEKDNIEYYIKKCIIKNLITLEL